MGERMGGSGKRHTEIRAKRKRERERKKGTNKTPNYLKAIFSLTRFPKHPRA